MGSEMCIRDSLSDVLSSFDMVQHVGGATHRCGNTLDLVMTFADYQLDAVTVDPPGIVSDHALVVCRLTAMKPHQRPLNDWFEAGGALIVRRFCACSEPAVSASRCLTTLMSTNCSQVTRRCCAISPINLRLPALFVVVLDV